MAEEPEWMLTDDEIGEIGFAGGMQVDICYAQARKIAEWFDRNLATVSLRNYREACVQMVNYFVREAKGEK